MATYPARIDIDCAKAPYNPMPIVQAVFGEVAKLRAASAAPIFIVSGESHFNDVECLLPYAAAQHAGLMNNTPVKHTLQFAFEYPHDTLTKTRAEFEEFFPGTLLPGDSPSVQLARILSEYGSGHPQNATRVMLKAFAAHDVPLCAIDASLKWGRLYPFLNEEDELTRQHMPTCHTPYVMGHRAYNPPGMVARNRIMAQLLRERHSHKNAVTWVQCGQEHVFERRKSNTPGIANLLPGHVIVLANQQELKRTGGFSGLLMTYNGIAQTDTQPQPATPQILSEIHKYAPLPPS